MANLDFFATRADHEALVRFLFGSTDVRVFESYSEFGRELREFRSLEGLAAAFEVGADPVGSGFAVLLQLWSPSVEPGPRIERVTLDPGRCGGHTFRYRIDGGGLIQLYFGGISGQTITKSHYGHFSEAGARKWGRSAGVDWAALKTLSNKIQHHIRNRLSVARVPGRPVLAEAYGYARSGYTLKEAASSPIAYQLPDVG